MRWDAILRFLEICILSGTMIFIYWQAKTASDEYKIKNKPVVGVESIAALFSVGNDPRSGKPAIWNASTKAFMCEDKPIDVQGIVAQVVIKNFGTEPAIDFNCDSMLSIGNTEVKTKDPEFKSFIMMPGQTRQYFTTVTKESVYDAFMNNKPIKLKYVIKYSDMTKKKELFESTAEISLISEGNLIARIIDGQFKDKR
jgi:hypothetical protein